MSTIHEMKERARRVIEAHAHDLQTLSLSIHDRPALGFQEYHAHGVLTDFLEGAGFSVARGAYEMPTAFCASRAAARRRSPCSASTTPCLRSATPAAII